MSPQQFQQAHLRGMAASPFTGTVEVLIGGDVYPVTGCVVRSGDNKAKAEEWGLQHVRTLSVQLPKQCNGVATLPRRPAADTDALRYDGREYRMVSISGDDAASPVWVIQANAPL